MNCKKGDLAIFVRSKAGNEGKIVQCLRLATLDELNAKHFNASRPVWIIDRAVQAIWGCTGPSCGLVRFASDCNLRPIGNPGEHEQDESLTWLPSPSRETSPA